MKVMRDDPRFGSCLVEVKVAKGKTLYEKQIAEHQRRALTLSHKSSIYFKIPDGTFSQSPADGFIFKKSEAYLVIYFDIKPKEIWAIHIRNLPITNISIDTARSIGIQIIL